MCTSHDEKKFYVQEKVRSTFTRNELQPRGCDELHTLFTKWPPGGVPPRGGHFVQKCKPLRGRTRGVPPHHPHHHLETSFEQLSASFNNF